MASFKDLFGVTEQEAAKDAAGNVTEAFGRVGDAAKELGVLFVKDVGKPLQVLKTQLEKNAKALVRSQKRGTISDRAARAASKANTSAMERVSKTSEELAKQNITGAAAAKEMNKEIQRAAKLTAQENKLLKAGLKARTLLQKADVAAMRAAQAGRRFGEAARFELKAGRINSGESKIVKGGAGALNTLAGKLPGSGGVGPSGFGGGAIDALASAGPWGMAGAGVAKLLSATMNVDRDAAIAATQKFLNYGAESTAGLGGDVEEVKSAFVTASKLAAAYNGDVEAISSSMTRIWTQTGEQVPKVAASFGRIEALRLAGLGSTDELTDLVIKRMNQTGKSMDAITQEMVDINLMAKTLQKSAGGSLVIQMDDFYKGVQDLADGMDSLVSNQKALAKTFAINLKFANGLTKSYDRNRAAALGLSKALTSNYDESFATVNVREELNAALQSGDKEVVANAQKILAGLENGEYLEDTAAKFAKELGVSTDATVTQFRLQFAKDTGGGFNMLKAQFGDMTSDTYDLVNKVMAQVGPGQRLEDVLPKLDAGTRQAFEEATGMAAAAQADPAKDMAAIGQQILQGVSSVIPDLLKAITDTLRGISSLITDVIDMLPSSWKKTSATSIAADAAQAKIAKREEGAVDAGDIIHDLMLSRLYHGNAETVADAKEASVGSAMNPANSDLFGQLRGSDAEAKAARAEMMKATGGAAGNAQVVRDALVEALGPREGATIFKQAREEHEAAKAARNAPPAATGPQTGTVTRSAPNAAGGTRTNIEVYDATAAKTAGKVNNQNSGNANSTSPVIQTN